MTNDELIQVMRQNLVNLEAKIRDLQTPKPDESVGMTQTRINAINQASGVSIGYNKAISDMTTLIRESEKN